MGVLDIEDFPPISGAVVARERAVESAAEGPSFDDVGTGEIPVTSVRVRTSFDVPDPIPAGEVAGMVPTVVPIRKPLRDEPPLFWVALCAGLVAAGFVAVWGMLAVGGYLGGAS